MALQRPRLVHACTVLGSHRTDVRAFKLAVSDASSSPSVQANSMSDLVWSDDLPTTPLPYDPADYPEYILHRPTEEELEAMEDAREPALSDPLKRGCVLAWSGPNRHPESLPPADYPPATTPDPSPHSPRPLVERLIAPDSPAHGGQGWLLRFIEAVQTGADRWSQVWRCSVVDESGKVLDETVVLKLYQQSLFPLPEPAKSFPQCDNWNWYPARHLESREAEAYSLLKIYQGRDIPLCYGFYRFRVPCGEDVVGVVLEDLLDTTETLAELVIREDYHKRFDMDKIDALVTACFDAQYRFQNCKVINAATIMPNILVVKGTWPGETHIVVVGFSKCRHADLDKLSHERMVERWDKSLPVGPSRYVWRKYDQSDLCVIFEGTITDSPVLFRHWRKMEKKRKKLPYLHLKDI
ncbi:hypothetical protein Rhopal_004189-T1 [Rhodotorula paludigena]|uniref:Uncharacterized protein n=1 Tax=Rhodotorula paludigena TaxID=86838 RepID=A0AAV5GF51_9BASI|nr:hypothetical protein Rhopal_004189-T1 [Rhodotorula paludigena]